MELDPKGSSSAQELQLKGFEMNGLWHSLVVDPNMVVQYAQSVVGSTLMTWYFRATTLKSYKERTGR